MYYLDKFPEEPDGFNAISTSAEWVPWLFAVMPAGTHATVRHRLSSNLKHIIVGLEMKAGLIIPHGERLAGKSVLFEPYCQIMTFEFCVGVFSVCEGLGSILFLTSKGDSGETGQRVRTNNWMAALVNHFDSDGALELAANVAIVKSVRDKMHQDRLGAREDIDWHELGYDEAFLPAIATLRALLRTFVERVPEGTNLVEVN